jgi:hypothetical protein
MKVRPLKMYGRYLPLKRRAVGTGTPDPGPGTGTGTTTLIALVSGTRYYNAANPVPAAYAEPAGNALPRIRLWVNGAPHGDPVYINVDGTGGSLQTVPWVVPFARTEIRSLELVFDNDWASSPYVVGQDRNVTVQRLIVEGPNGNTVFLPSEGDYRRDVGSVDSPGPGTSFVNGRWRWLNAGAKLGATTPAPSNGQGAITRNGPNLEYNGQKFRGFFPNFQPWSQMDGTWSTDGKARAIAEIGRLKTLWGANGVRLTVAPGEWVYWTAAGKYDELMDAILDEIAAQGMFAIFDYWTVGNPGGTVESYPYGNVLPFYMSSISTWEAYWAHHAERYKNRRWLMLSPWDEFLNTVPWSTLRGQLQRVVDIIRQAGNQSVIVFGGLNYSQDVRDYDNYPIVDPLDQLCLSFHNFGSEPHNFNSNLFTTTVPQGRRLDLVYPWVAGGYSIPLTGSTPTNSADATWMARVKAESAILCPWSHSEYSGPPPLASGWPTDETPTLNTIGVYLKATAPAGLLYQSGSTAPPSETFTPDYYLDTVNGNDVYDGQSAAKPKRSWGAVAALMAANKKLGIARGSVINQFVQINGWAGATVGVYGSGDKPKFRNSRFYSGGQIELVRAGVWRVNVGAMPQSTAFAAARVTHATIVIVNDAHVCSWFAWNGANEVGARNDMFWHAGGYLYFASPVTPTLVEVPWEDVALVQNADGITIQDIDSCGSRGHGWITGSVGGLKFKRCTVRRTGLSGLYVQSKSGALTNGIEITGNLFEDCHAEGIVVNWPGNVRNAFRTTKVKENTVRRCCKGPPFIKSGTTSQDYYSAGIKLFTQVWESPAWDNDIEVSFNLIEDMGNTEIPYVYSGSYRYDGVGGYESNQAMGIWSDTVTGGATNKVWIHSNTVRRTWAAGVFVEACYRGGHLVEKNYLDRTGLQLTGYSGGICFGRGTRGAIAKNNTIYLPKNSGLTIQGGQQTMTSGDGASFDERVENCQFNENIVVVTGGVPVIMDRSRVGQGGNTFDKNCLYGGQYVYRGDSSVWSNGTTYANAAAYGSARGGGVSGTIEADPQLRAPGSGDFALVAGSPCLGAGTGGINIGAWQG